MITSHTPESLIAFEADIAREFNSGAIRAPIHLSGNNERQLIEIFKDVGPTDWVCTNWRSHYHALLRGVPPAEVKEAIMLGRSITLCFPKYRVISSAIVGGVLPIALGIAWTIKREQMKQQQAERSVAGPPPRVWAFCGDMTSFSGMFLECRRYAAGFHLPIKFVIEDNSLSVCTQTVATWGSERGADTKVGYYHYKLPWPHAGAGKRIEF